MHTSHHLAEFLRSPLFEYVVLPFGAAFVMVFVKTQCKPPAPTRFSFQDLAVGLDLTLAAILSFATYAVSLSRELLGDDAQKTQQRSPQLEEYIRNLADKQAQSLYAVLFFTIGLWALSELVSSYGWKTKDELNFTGIMVPILAAGVAFTALASFIAN